MVIRFAFKMILLNVMSGGIDISKSWRVVIFSQGLRPWGVLKYLRRHPSDSDSTEPFFIESNLGWIWKEKARNKRKTKLLTRVPPLYEKGGALSFSISLLISSVFQWRNFSSGTITLVFSGVLQNRAERFSSPKILRLKNKLHDKRK